MRILHLPLELIISNQQKEATLQLELAGTVDYGEPFVKSTYMYNLEGDGPLALKALMLCLLASELVVLPTLKLLHKSIITRSILGQATISEPCKEMCATRA